jgi:hypothetical protein
MNKVTTLLHNKAEADKDTFAVFAVAAVCVWHTSAKRIAFFRGS